MNIFVSFIGANPFRVIHSVRIEKRARNSYLLVYLSRLCFHAHFSFDPYRTVKLNTFMTMECEYSFTTQVLSDKKKRPYSSIANKLCIYFKFLYNKLRGNQVLFISKITFTQLWCGWVCHFVFLLLKKWFMERLCSFLELKKTFWSL